MDGCEEYGRAQLASITRTTSATHVLIKKAVEFSGVKYYTVIADLSFIRISFNRIAISSF